MDEATRVYQLSQSLSGVEKSPSPDIHPANLTEDEARLNAALRRDDGTAYRCVTWHLRYWIASTESIRSASSRMKVNRSGT
jgi:hypothetical protein